MLHYAPSWLCYHLKVALKYIKGEIFVKKLLSSLLVLALALGYCAPCLAAGNEPTQTKTAQEKEIEKIKEDLSKHNKEKLEEIDKLKWMSDDSYSEYKFEQYLNKFFGILAYVLTGAGTLALTFSYGKKSTEQKLKNTELYKKGFDDGIKATIKGMTLMDVYFDGKKEGEKWGNYWGKKKGLKEGYKKGYKEGRESVFNQFYNLSNNYKIREFVNLLSTKDIKDFLNLFVTGFSSSKYKYTGLVEN